MKKMILLTAAITLVLGSCSAGSKNLRTEKDSLAYAVGIDFGNYIKERVDSTLNVDIVAAAMKDVLAGKTTMEKDTAYNFIREYFMVRKPAKEKIASEEFLSGIEKNNKNVQKTSTGLLYEVIEPGNDTKPTSNDRVKVIYEGTLKDGQVFDSSKQRGDTAEFGLNQVIPGWSEGLTYVGEGGKIRLWIPSDLGYGAQGAGQMIGPNQALVFDVELIEVIPADEEEETTR